MSDDLEEFNKVYGVYLQGKADAIDEMQNPKNLVCYEDKFLHCPCCDEALSYKWDKYPIKTVNLEWLKFCWNCGQALKWE